MQSSNTSRSQIGQWADESNELGQFRKQVRFLMINQNFQFRITLTRNIKMFLLLAHGHLVFNNGLTVPINAGHQRLFNRVLNHSNNRVVFAVDISSQTLVFTAKALGVIDSNKAEEWVREVEKQAMSKKRLIETLMAVIGIEMDSQHQLMRQILKAKKDLKDRIEIILEKSQPIKIQKVQMKMDIQSDQSEASVIAFGLGTDIEIISKSMLKQGRQSGQKKNEGGYFSIEQQEYFINNKRTHMSETKTLCKKTLKEKRMNQEHSLQNQQKMKKELLIVDSIKDPKFLVKYYYEGDMDNLKYVLMDKWDFNLQEYIYYYGDSLEVSNKITISKKLVQAVTVLHRWGVVHRDIKPTNILIDDSVDDCALKIIDFAESYSSRINFEIEDYGSSFPYSPLECNERQNVNPQGSRKGIVNEQIDYWSVGMTIYQIFFRKLPVSFSKTFLSDITASWKNELLLAVNQRQKYGLAVIDQVITIICVKMIKFDQTERMKLQTAYALLQELQIYVSELVKIIEKQMAK